MTPKQIAVVAARAVRHNELRKKYEAKAVDAQVDARREVTSLCEELIGPLPSKDGERVIRHLVEQFDVKVSHP